MTSVPTQQSTRWSLNDNDWKAIKNAAIWSLVSSVSGFLIALIPTLHVPTEYAALVAAMIPVINTLLVAIHKLAQDRGSLI